MDQSESSRRKLHRSAELLEKAGLKFRLEPEPGYIQLNFETEHYRDRDGDKSLALYLSFRDEGELLLVEAPWLYRLADARSRGAARKALLFANYAIKSMQLSVDPSDDDEVRARLELWQPGVDLGEDYLHSHLARLAMQIDYCDRLLRPVWTGGKRELRRLVASNMRVSVPDHERPAKSQTQRARPSARRNPPPGSAESAEGGAG